MQSSESEFIVPTGGLLILHPLAGAPFSAGAFNDALLATNPTFWCGSIIAEESLALAASDKMMNTYVAHGLGPLLKSAQIKFHYVLSMTNSRFAWS